MGEESKKDKVSRKGMHKINGKVRQGELRSKKGSSGGEDPMGQTQDLPEPMELKPEVVKAKNKSKSNLKAQKKKDYKKEPEVEGYTGNESLEDLVIKSIKWSETIYNQNKKIKRKLTIMLVGSYLKLLIIVVPLVFAIIYLPPLLGEVIGQYSQLLGGSGVGLNMADMLQQVGGMFSNMTPEQMEQVQGALKTMPK